MQHLYFTKSKDLFDSELPGVKNWSAIFKMLAVPIGLIDRNRYVTMPYRYKVYDGFDIPKNLDNFNLTYEECCIKRALELDQLSKQLNKPITIFYSGGIDSTAVLVSFMKILDSHDLKNRVRVAMTPQSICENVSFFYEHIRTKCTIVTSETYTTMMDGSSLIVGGECNDQLFGSDILSKLVKYSDGDKLHDRYSRDYIVSWFSKFMSVDAANKWFDVLDEQIRNSAPCEVTSNFHFFWWYNFCYKWQFVYFRFLAFIDPSLRSLVNQNFIDTYYHHFFNSTDFQKWSMLNHDKKMTTEWTSYKLESKKFIFDYNKDEIYLKNKIKIGSLYNLMIKKIVTKAITDDYVFLDNIDLNEFYVPNNSFV